MPSSLEPRPTPSVRAFPTHPRPDRYFPADSAEEARNRLTKCVERGEGPALLVGAAGVGKTMLLEVLRETLKDRRPVATLNGAQLCTRRALLQSLLHALDLPHGDRDEGELRLAIADYFADPEGCPSGVVLLVDEAHALPPRLLEELRLLGNLAREGEPLVRLVLAGAAALDEQLASPEMEALNQRIAARCYLSPMGYDELLQYVRAHIASTGADADALLTGDAAAAVFEATDGIPRLVNQLCDRAIVLAVEAGAERIDREAIQNAWADLHQLPAPWHSPAAAPSDPLDENLSGPVAGEWPPADLSLESTPAAPASGPDVGLDGELHAGPDAELIDEPTPPSSRLLADQAAARPIAVPSPATPPPAEPEPVANPEPLGEPLAADPFGDDFEDEETLLDPYAGFDNPFLTGAPLVTNQEDTTISELVATLAPPPGGEDETELDEPEPEAEPEAESTSASNATQPAGPPSAAGPSSAAGEPTTAETRPSDATGTTTGLGEEPATLDLPLPLNEALAVAPPADLEDDLLAEVAAIDVGGDPAVLLIEEDSPSEAAPAVRRQEYRQLFAGLRGG